MIVDYSRINANYYARSSWEKILLETGILLLLSILLFYYGMHLLVNNNFHFIDTVSNYFNFR